MAKIELWSAEELPLPDDLSRIDDVDVLAELSFAITRLLETDRESLMSMLYRLDVAEASVRQSLLENEHPAEAIAKLVLNRQMRRLKTKAHYRQEKIPGSDLSW